MEISKEEYTNLIERASRSEQRVDQLSSELVSIRESLNRLDIKLDQILACLNSTDNESCKKEIQAPSVPHEILKYVPYVPTITQPYPYPYGTWSKDDNGNIEYDTGSRYRPECIGVIQSSFGPLTGDILEGKQIISDCVSRILGTSSSTTSTGKTTTTEVS